MLQLNAQSALLKIAQTAQKPQCGNYSAFSEWCCVSSITPFLYMEAHSLDKWFSIYNKEIPLKSWISEGFWSE